MEELIQILDFVSAAIIVITLNLVVRNYRWWIVYALNCILFGLVTIYNGLPGLTIMAVILGITGVKNYFVEKKKEKEKIGDPISGERKRDRERIYKQLKQIEEMKNDNTHNYPTN